METATDPRKPVMAARPKAVLKHPQSKRWREVWCGSPTRSVWTAGDLSPLSQRARDKGDGLGREVVAQDVEVVAEEQLIHERSLKKRRRVNRRLGLI